MNDKLTALKKEIDELRELEQASPELQAARQKVHEIEHAHDSDPQIIFNRQLVTRLKQELTEAEARLASAEKALLYAEGQHAGKVRDAVAAADSLEQGDLSKLKAATDLGFKLTDKYKMSLPELRALVD